MAHPTSAVIMIGIRQAYHSSQMPVYRRTSPVPRMPSARNVETFKTGLKSLPVGGIDRKRTRGMSPTPVLHPSGKGLARCSLTRILKIIPGWSNDRQVPCKTKIQLEADRTSVLTTAVAAGRRVSSTASPLCEERR